MTSFLDALKKLVKDSFSNFDEKLNAKTKTFIISAFRNDGFIFASKTEQTDKLRGVVVDDITTMAAIGDGLLPSLMNTRRVAPGGVQYELTPLGKLYAEYLTTQSVDVQVDIRIAHRGENLEPQQDSKLFQRYVRNLSISK